MANDLTIIETESSIQISLLTEHGLSSVSLAIAQISRMNRIVVSRPQQGLGTILLSKLCEIADEKGITIQNEVMPYRPMTWPPSFKKPPVKVYIKWYKKHGFELVDEQDGTALMIRHPLITRQFKEVVYLDKFTGRMLSRSI